MTNQLTKVFNGSNVRIVEIDGEFWFVAKDVCAVLELSDVSKTLNRLEDDEKGKSLIRTHGGTQEMLIVNEYGLYSLILGSRKPEAKEFKRWVTHEVLPSIRKTGSYVSHPTLPTNYKEALVALLGEVEKNEVLALEVQTLQPKAKYTEEVLLSGDALTITQIAKDLGMNGQKLNAKLHELGVQFKQGKVWYLYEQYDGLGYTKAHTYNVEGRTPTLTKWTQKGRKFIIDLLKEVE